MPVIAAVAAFLVSAQPPAPAGQEALASCLAGFVAAQQQAGTAVADVVSALATVCHAQERAYREAYFAAAAARGIRFVAADGEAYRSVLTLRTFYRDAYLAARPACAAPRRRP